MSWMLADAITSHSYARWKSSVLTNPSSSIAHPSHWEILPVVVIAVWAAFFEHMFWGLCFNMIQSSMSYIPQYATQNATAVKLQQVQLVQLGNYESNPFPGIVCMLLLCLFLRVKWFFDVIYRAWMVSSSPSLLRPNFPDLLPWRRLETAFHQYLLALM